VRLVRNGAQGSMKNFSALLSAIWLLAAGGCVNSTSTVSGTVGEPADLGEQVVTMQELECFDSREESDGETSEHLGCEAELAIVNEGTGELVLEAKDQIAVSDEEEHGGWALFPDDERDVVESLAKTITGEYDPSIAVVQANDTGRFRLSFRLPVGTEVERVELKIGRNIVTVTDAVQ
jgi:hypothetical protein